MLWIKRNLFFVISIVVGLGLTGFCGYLFYTDLAANTDIKTEWDSTVLDYTNLLGKNPYPSQENITKVKDDQQKIQGFLADFNKVFTPFPAPPRVDEQGFKTYLEQSIFDLRTAADADGVKYPDGFGFAFAEQQSKLNYPHENIQPWMEELMQVKDVCGILFHAKVYNLDTLMRTPVSQNDSGKDTLQGVRVTTNGMQIITSYKIVFHGFSQEVASVLEGFAGSTHCFIIKNIDVRPAAGTTTVPSRPGGALMTPIPSPAGPGPIPVGTRSSSSTTTPGAPATPAGPNAPLRRGGGPGRRGGPAGGNPPAAGVDPRAAIMQAEALKQQQANAVGAAATPKPRKAAPGPASTGGATTTELSAHLLQVTLSLDAIKFKSMDH